MLYPIDVELYLIYCNIADVCSGVRFVLHDIQTCRRADCHRAERAAGQCQNCAQPSTEQLYVSDPPAAEGKRPDISGVSQVGNNKPHGLV